MPNLYLFLTPATKPILTAGAGSKCLRCLFLTNKPTRLKYACANYSLKILPCLPLFTKVCLFLTSYYLTCLLNLFSAYSGDCFGNQTPISLSRCLSLAPSPCCHVKYYFECIYRCQLTNLCILLSSIPSRTSIWNWFTGLLGESSFRKL